MKMQAILLAAGLSTRMGRQKLLLPFGGKTVVESVIDNLRGAGFSKINAVLSREVAAAIASPPGVETRVNEAPERGQSSSLAIGLAMLPEGVDFCIMLGDLPLVGSEDMAALAEKFSALPPGKSVLAPCREGVFGHPMFYRALWKKRFADASGDAGGRNILKRFAEEVELVPAPAAHFKDMDTPEEYEALLSKARLAGK